MMSTSGRKTKAMISVYHDQSRSRRESRRPGRQLTKVAGTLFWLVMTGPKSVGRECTRVDRGREVIFRGDLFVITARQPSCWSSPFALDVTRARGGVSMMHSRRLSRRAPWVAIVATCVMSVFSTQAFAGKAATTPQSVTVQKTEELRIVTASGVGEVMLMPDSLRTSISIRARAEKLEQAREEAATKTRAVIKALEGLKLQFLQVRTVDITTTPITETIKETTSQTRPRIIGYEAASTLSVALKGVAPDVLRVEGPRVLETALNAGANVVGGFSFFLSKPRDAYRQALAVSIQDAEKNATVMADAAAIRMVGLQTLSTESAQVYEYAQKAVYDSGEGGGGEVGFPVEIGEIRVTAHVTARHLFTK
jgi:uncharacterized protein YggE